MTFFKLTLKNITTSWIKRLLEIFVIFVSVPMITQHFGLELMGIWLLATQLSQHIILLEFGFNTSLTRLLARYRAKGDQETASIFLSTSILILACIGFFVFVISPIIANYFVKTFEFSSSLVDDIYWLMVTTSCFTGANLALRSGIGMLSSRHLFHRIALWESIGLLMRLGLLLLCFRYLKINFLILAIIFYTPILLTNIILFKEGLKCNNDLEIRSRLVKWWSVNNLISVSLASLVITIAAVIVRQTSSLITGWTLGYEEVANITFPILIIFALLPFISIAATLMSPLASQLDAEGKHEQFYEVYTNVAKYVFAMMSIVFVFFYLLGNQVLFLWLGGPNISWQQIHEINTNTLIILFGVTLAMPGFILRQIMIAIGRHWNVAIGEILGSIAGIMLGYLLMASTSLGISGMSIGISLAFLIRSFFFNTRQGAIYFNKTFYEINSDVIVMPCVILVIATIASYFSWYIVDHFLFYSALLHFLTIVILWGCGLWVFVIDDEHKVLVQNITRRFIGGF